MKKRKLFKNILLLSFICFVICFNRCAGTPPPVEQAPLPPPAYGQDPFQMASSSQVNSAIPLVSLPLPPSRELSKEEADNYLAKAIQDREKQLALGFDLEGEISSIKVKAGDEKKFQVSGEKGKCLRILGVSDPGVPQIDLYLYDGENLLDRDIAPDNFPVVSHCFNANRDVILVLKVISGSGWFIVRVYSKKDDGTVKKTMEAVESSSKK